MWKHYIRPSDYGGLGEVRVDLQLLERWNSRLPGSLSGDYLQPRFFFLELIAVR